MENPDPWQVDVIKQLVRNHDNALMLCARGAGKTKAVAAAVYAEACLGGFALVVSRSDRQAMKVLNYVIDYHRRSQLVDTARSSMHELAFRNGGRVLALPCREDTIRGEHGVTLLVIDEASRVPDAVYGTVTAMTGVSKGRVALLSTPFGRRGFFYREWIGEGAQNWHRHRYPWHQCPRLTAEFLTLEKQRQGEQWCRQEYLDCPDGDEFLAVESSMFDPRQFEAAINPQIVPLDW